MNQQASRYFVPDPSHLPLVGSAALFLLASGAVLWMNKFAVGPYVVLSGFVVLLFMLFGWFGRVIDESEHGRYNKQVDVSFRWGMSWFIFSEVMFFAAFFGALFYVRVLSVPDLASALTMRVRSWPWSRNRNTSAEARLATMATRNRMTTMRMTAISFSGQSSLTLPPVP